MPPYISCRTPQALLEAQAMQHASCFGHTAPVGCLRRVLVCLRRVPLISASDADIIW